MAITLCILLLAAAGAGVATAKQDENPRQAGASSVYFYDVAATDTHGSGKLMINLDQKKFVLNGKDFEPGTKYVLHYSTSDSPDLRVFATGQVTPSGNLHVEGRWEGNFADPDAAGFGVGASSAITGGTIQRAAGEYCYALIYSDAFGDYTVYLPFDAITYAEGGHDLPKVIAEPAPVDYVKIYSSTLLIFGYQGVYYTADYSSSCPYTPPVMTVSGSYSPYREWNSEWGWYDWYWNLNYHATYDASHLPPGVVLQRVSWSIIGMYDDWMTPWEDNIPHTCLSQYSQRTDAWLGFPAIELPITNSYSINANWESIGCTTCALCGDEVCPEEEWDLGPPFTAIITITTTDGNSYTTTATMTAAF